MDFESHRRSKYRIDLETPRLLLRPLIAGDVDWLAGLCADPEVNRFLWDRDATPEAARRAAEAMISLDLARSCFGQWAIRDKTTADIHGWAELSKLRPWSGPSDEIALSYVLRRSSWGCGIATEAAGRLLRHAFEVHQMHRIMAVIFADNAPSRRVLEKLGMRRLETAASACGSELEYFSIHAPALPRRAV